MQPEGSNKSEERLQRYAKERRAQGGDFSLHPATRRLLQGEVVRQLGARAKAEQTPGNWFNLWRRHFAVGGALAAVLIAGTWLFFHSAARKSSRVELASVKISLDEKNVALESDHLALDAEATKPGRGATPALMRNEPANTTAERGRVLDGIVANEFQLGAKLDTNNLAFGSSTRENGGMVHFYADVASVLPIATNATVTTLSFAFSTDSWDSPSLSSTSQTKSPPNIETGVIAGGAAGAAGATDSALFADNATRFYRLNTPLPQVVLRNDSDGAKPLSEVTQLTKTQPEVAYQNVGEPAALAVQNANTPAPARPAPAQLPANSAGLGDSLAKSQAGGQQLNVEARSGIDNRAAGGSRADVNKSQVFYKQAVAPAEPLANAEGLVALQVVQKSEDAAASQVLSQFTVEQRGSAVRLMDFDGSVYSGVIDAPAAVETEKLKESLARDKDTAAGVRALREEEVRQAGDANQTREYSFRASGSNAAARQLVVVTARFRFSTNASNAVLNRRGFGAGGGGLAGENRPGAAPTGPADARRSLDRFGRAGAATNSTLAIEGTVQVGPTNVQRFIAVPGARP